MLNLKIFWNTLEQCFSVLIIVIIFRDIGLGTFKIWKLELKTSKNKSRKFTTFQANQYTKQNSNLSLYSIFMRYDSELFSNVSQFAFYYS